MPAFGALDMPKTELRKLLPPAPVSPPTTTPCFLPLPGEDTGHKHGEVVPTAEVLDVVPKTDEHLNPSNSLSARAFGERPRDRLVPPADPSAGDRRGRAHGSTRQPRPQRRTRPRGVPVSERDEQEPPEGTRNMSAEGTTKNSPVTKNLDLRSRENAVQENNQTPPRAPAVPPAEDGKEPLKSSASSSARDAVAAGRVAEVSPEYPALFQLLYPTCCVRQGEGCSCTTLPSPACSMYPPFHCPPPLGAAGATTSCCTTMDDLDQEDLREKLQECRRAVQEDGRVLRECPDAARAEPQIVMEAVRQYGAALQHANTKLRKNKDIVLASVAQHWSALQ